MTLVRGSTSRQIFQSSLLITPFTSHHSLVALVSCDNNSTDASDVNDIFTLARDRGGVSAVRPAAIAVCPTLANSALV